MTADFLQSVAKAIEAQPGLVQSSPVDKNGNVCALGAYGIVASVEVRDAVALLRGGNVANYKHRLDLAAAASERAIEVMLSRAGAIMLKAITDYNDGRTWFVFNEIPTNETPVQRRDRVASALRRNSLPGLTNG